MKYILIPSAKCAPNDLPNYGKLPMALYPINGHTILQHIANNYSVNDNIVVTGYEEFDALQRYLTINKYKNISLYKLKVLKDLGNTIKETLEYLKITNEDQIVINFADTLIDNENIPTNSIVCISGGEISKKWTYFTHTEGIITSILDRKEANFNLSNSKLFVGVISISHPLDFLKNLRYQPCDSNTTLFEALKLYSNSHPFEFVEAQHWLDLGHPDDYFNSQISIKAREFNHMSFDRNRGILRKTSDDKSKFKGEIEWYLKLPNKLKYVSPRIFDSCVDYDNLYVEMEFYSYPTLLELYLYGNIGREEWKRIFSKIKFVLNDFAKYEIKDDKIKKSLYEIYYTKTVERLGKLKNNNNFSSMFDSPIMVNGKKYKNLNKIMALLEVVIKKELLDVQKFCIIHGDMCFANVLIDEKLNFIKLIDPRGKFGEFDIYGDQRYEIAKLFHSVDGKYDYIIKDLFEVEKQDNTINYKIFDKFDFSLFELMKEELQDLIGNQQRNIEIIESLLFLSMIPLHGENIKHQYAMLAVGLDILNRHVNITSD